MGFNFFGFAIDKNFNKDPEKVGEFLELPLEYVDVIDFESGSGYKDGNYLDIFFSDRGTLVYTYDPMEIDPAISKDSTVLTYMVSETAMVFYYSLDVKGSRVREIYDNEGDLSVSIGDGAEEIDDLMEVIVNEKNRIFGIDFYDIPLDLKGYRYKLINSSKEYGSRIESNGEEPYKAPFYDSSAMASNPGKVSLDFIQWIKMNFFDVVKKTSYMIVPVLLMIWGHWLFVLLLILGILYNVRYWFNSYNIFQAGDVNPGKVIHVNPDVVAVTTNMTKLFGDYPIVKVFETQLTKEEKRVGAYIPTVAFYLDNPYDYPFWAEFLPVPFSHGTKDKAILKSKMDSFSKEDFQELDNHYRQVESLGLGTFKVNERTSDWKDYRDIEIGSCYNIKDPEER